jgi:hypothetical protein
MTVRLFMTFVLKKIKGRAKLEKNTSKLCFIINRAKTIIDDSKDKDSNLELDISNKSTNTKTLLDEIASDIKFYDLRLIDLLLFIERIALQLKNVLKSKKALNEIYLV